MKEILHCFTRVKTILSLLFCCTTCYLAIKGKIQMETFMAMTMAIITYYFNRKDIE